MKISLLAVGLALLFSMTGCEKGPFARGPKIPQHKRPEIVRPDTPDSPEAKAAEQLIASGQQALQDEDNEKAEWHFQEAVRIAPTFGPAYYWLARAKWQLDQRTEAWNLLDRAELLIGHEADWLEKIDELRATISDAS